MSVSLYYTAKRATALTSHERAEIDALVGDAIKSAGDKDWEPFFVYDPADPTEPGMIFEGATQLPDDSPEEMWEALQHWAALLTQIRRRLPAAEWNVHMDDHDLVWVESEQSYDPSQ